MTAFVASIFEIRQAFRVSSRFYFYILEAMLQHSFVSHSIYGLPPESPYYNVRHGKLEPALCNDS